MTPQSHAPRAVDRRKRLSERERALAALADRQHGVISRGQLLATGLGSETIKARLRSGRLHRVHRGVYALGRRRITLRGDWMGAVLACGEGALLSHASAAALWGLIRPRSSAVDVTSSHGRSGRRGIRLHRGRIDAEDRTARDSIPVTSLPRTLLDLADVVDGVALERAFEEADRLGLLQLSAMARVCDRGAGRRGLALCRRLVAEAKAPITTRSPLEDRFAAFCHAQRLPLPAFNVSLLGREVDALWPRERLVVELDGFAFHRHRAAFERDRARDAALQAAGYRVVRLTHRRIEAEPWAVAGELERLLASDGGGVRAGPA